MRSFLCFEMSWIRFHCLWQFFFHFSHSQVLISIAYNSTKIIMQHTCKKKYCSSNLYTCSTQASNATLLFCIIFEKSVSWHLFYHSVQFFFSQNVFSIRYYTTWICVHIVSKGLPVCYYFSYFLRYTYFHTYSV